MIDIIGFADKAAMVLSYRNAVAKGQTVEEYAADLEYSNLIDAIPALTLAAHYNRTIFAGTDDRELEDMARVKIVHKDVDNVLVKDIL